jgi:hypothetical protein
VSPSLSRPSSQASAGDFSESSLASRQPGSAGKSTSPSPSSSAPSLHAVASLASTSEEQPGSAGKSTSVSPSLSAPSSQTSDTDFSESSVAPLQPGSARSATPSPSSSAPFSHAVVSVASLGDAQPGSAG